MGMERNQRPGFRNNTLASRVIAENIASLEWNIQIRCDLLKFYVCYELVRNLNTSWILEKRQHKRRHRIASGGQDLTASRRPEIQATLRVQAAPRTASPSPPLRRVLWLLRLLLLEQLVTHGGPRVSAAAKLGSSEYGLVLPAVRVGLGLVCGPRGPRGRTPPAALEHGVHELAAKLFGDAVVGRPFEFIIGLAGGKGRAVVDVHCGRFESVSIHARM